MIGQTLGKYRIIEHLGTGGMSEVYKAYQPGLDRYVAIKVLHAFLATEEDFLTRFQREAKVAAMLRHPNIVRVHDFDTQDKAYYMVMEFIDGPSLKARLQDMARKGQPLPLEEAIRITLAMAEALDYAHQRGTVHRDVKPANIMFTQDGEVVLTDFGIAKMVNVSGLTASGAMVGTPAYMAPEQGMGQAGDERADIYSLGVVLYQLVTGSLPFDAETPMGIVLKHINEPLTSPTAVNPDLPPSIEMVVMRAMEKTPEQRYQSAREMATDLRQAVAGPAPHLDELDATTISTATATGVGVQPQMTSRWERATLPSAPGYTPTTNVIDKPRRRRVRWLALILVLLLLGGGAALHFTGQAEPLLASVTGFISQVLTPPPGANDQGTPTADVYFATQVAVVVATRDAEATLQATRNFTPSPTPTDTPTPTPTPTRTPIPTPTPDQTEIAMASCEFDLAVVQDYPLQTSILVPGQTFIKRWRVENTGTCTWPRGIELIYASGEELEVVEVQAVQRLEPEESTEIEITLRAPESYDSYESVWQLQDIEGNPIGEDLEITFRVGATPTPRPTTPPPTPTLTATAQITQTEPLWMSTPLMASCTEDGGRVEWGFGGGPSDTYRFFYGGVAPEFELAGPYNDIGFPHPMTYFTTSGPLTFPVPENCCPGNEGRYVNPEEGYEIVWQKVYMTEANCP